MRLRSPKDRFVALSELGRNIASQDEISNQDFTTILEKRPDWRKSQDQKARWRRNRRTYMTGIKKFHKSTEGKKFHRQLARYMATRLTTNESEAEIRSTVDDFLVALSSARTHLYIDLGYYKPVLESLEYVDLLDEIIPVLNEIELKFIRGEYTQLSINELEVILRLISGDIIEETFNVKIDNEKLESEDYLSKLILGN